MRKLLILYVLISAFISSKAQVEIQLTKITQDSISIEVDEGLLEMNKPTSFVVKTNITIEDSLYMNLPDDKLPITPGKKFSYKFDHHSYRLFVFKKTSSGTAQLLSRNSKLLAIKGTRFKVSVDGKEIDRHSANSISSNSSIDIELISEHYALMDLSIKQQVIFAWEPNRRIRKDVWFSDKKLSFSMEDEGFVDGMDGTAKWNYVVIILPQVYNRGKRIFSKDHYSRMYRLKYELN